MNLCKCGCGQEVKNVFVMGHHRRRVSHTKKSKVLISQKTRIKSAWNKGISWSEESKHKMSISHIGQKAWNKGIPCSDETKFKISKTKLGKPGPNKGKKFGPLSNERKKKLSEIQKGIENAGRFKKGFTPWNKGLIMKMDKRVRKYTDSRNKTIKESGVFNTIEYKNLQSEASKKKWKRDEYVQNQMKSRKVKPNKLEKYFEKYLNILYPKEWKYVGDGKLIINGKCPDFVNVNGQKKLIEIFGDFWHKNDNPEDRIQEFKLFGWDTLVLWEKDIRKNSNLGNIINNFIYDRKLLRRNISKEINK